MHPDFSVLSMTELRNAPGEVLDRVATKGEAFIIERNGDRKACLVPLSLFFPDISPARLAAEFTELERHNELVRTTFTDQREIALRFKHSISTKPNLEVTIILPNGYPHQCPRVYAGDLGKRVPHRWSDGSLCIFGVMTTWNPGKHTVYSTLRLARRWLDRFDVWQKSGRWPKSEVVDERR